MTDLTFDTALNTLLNQFSVPMFALDRSKPEDDFHYVCVNRALEVGGRRPASEMLGKTAHQIMPKDEADISRTRYAQCVASKSDLRFRDRFTTAGQLVLWDTTLQHVALNDGRDRVIGTCIQLSENDTAAGKDPTLEDIQYFSSMADFQLQNLISTFEIFRGKDLFSLQNEQHIDKLTGMCRTVQRAVEDIKKVVKSRNQPAGASQSALQDGGTSATLQQTNRAGSDTIEALFSDATEDLRRFS